MPKRTFCPDEQLGYALAYERFRAEWFTRVGDHDKALECSQIADHYQSRLTAHLSEHLQ